MHDLIFRLHKDWLVNQRKFAFGMSCLVVLGSLSCFGQPSSLAPQIMSAQQQVKWTTGPATANLGEVAEMEIPAGYRFADAAGARVLLQRMKNPVPAGLVGILTPESGGWWAVLEFADTGYVKPASVRRIDAPTILKGMWAKVEIQNALRTKQGLPPVKSVNWEIAPEYDAADNSLACAIRIEAPPEAIVNQSIRLFGRRGVLLATSVQKVKGASETFPLKELLQHVTFKPGQRYGDYQEGDKVAGIDTYQLLTGDEQTIAAAEKGWKAFFNRRTNIWIVSVLGVCIFVLVIYMVTKEIRSIKTRQAFPSSSARNGTPAKARKVRRPVNEADAAGRKRAFDYQKFYSDMMMQVSTRSYTGLVLKPAEEPVPETVEPSAALPAPSAAIAYAQKDAASELIARQKDFIEEQRRLMQQQTKLIEERSKLIEEKNQLLAKQTEMLENHLL